MPQNTFFLQTRDLLVSQKTMQRHFFFSTSPPRSPVIFAAASVVAFVLLRNSRFNFHCYTQCLATPTQKSAWKWCCHLSRVLAQKITKGNHSCKPASLFWGKLSIAVVHPVCMLSLVQVKARSLWSWVRRPPSCSMPQSTPWCLWTSWVRSPRPAPTAWARRFSHRCHTSVKNV